MCVVVTPDDVFVVGVVVFAFLYVGGDEETFVGFLDGEKGLFLHNGHGRASHSSFLKEHTVATNELGEGISYIKGVAAVGL